MKQNYLCVTIPLDLLCYQKISDTFQEDKLEVQYSSEMELSRNKLGQIERIDYYENSILSKSIIYQGSSIIENRYYKQSVLYLVEEITSNKVCSKTYYKKDGSPDYKIEYQYNRQGKIISIKKNKQQNEFTVIYGYDELERINSRKIYMNSNLINEQKYRFNILDKVVEYRDSYQVVSIEEINPSGELISYKITDKMRNEIVVKNMFIHGLNSNTIINMNGYSTNVIDKNYVDNIMLKKPYTNEYDLDLIISQLFSPTPKTHRITANRNSEQSLDAIIDNNIQKNIQIKTLPISIRKSLLFNIEKN